MTEEDGKLPREKWVDLTRLFTRSSVEPAVLMGEEMDSLPEIYGVTDLDKTEEEMQSIQEVVAALNHFRYRMLGLDPRTFSLDRVHVLTLEEFHAKVVPERFSGKMMFGHIYIPRNPSPADFQGILAHEMVHAFSYLWLDFHGDGSEAWPGEKWKPVTIRRTGLALVDPSFGTWLPHFHGLNEGVTESVALMVRGSLARRTKVLDEEGRKCLSCWMSSPPLVHFTDKLVCVVTGEQGDSVETWRILARDMFDGTDEFLKLLEAELPGATDRLRRTGATPSELLAAANDLGLTDVAKYVAKYCK